MQLRRFLVPEATRRPNLASQCLGIALRELSAQWLAEHDYHPLLAESFSDPESHHGTVYKATNWPQAPPPVRRPEPRADPQRPTCHYPL